MTACVYPLERKIMLLAKALEPLIRCLYAHQLAVILSEQQIVILPGTAHIEYVFVLLRLVLPEHFNHLFRHSDLADRSVGLGYAKIHTPFSAVLRTLDDTQLSIVKVDVLPLKTQYLALTQACRWTKAQTWATA